MEKVRVLFLCRHNSARSQMAEAFLNHIGGDIFFAESAGFLPESLNPFVVKSMKEVGIDISQCKSKDVFRLYLSGRIYNQVISVCEESPEDNCPIFPGMEKSIWPFKDPRRFTGTDQEIMRRVRQVRDAIQNKITLFVAAERRELSQPKVMAG